MHYILMAKSSSPAPIKVYVADYFLLDGNSKVTLTDDKSKALRFPSISIAERVAKRLHDEIYAYEVCKV